MVSFCGYKIKKGQNASETEVKNTFLSLVHASGKETYISEGFALVTEAVFEKNLANDLRLVINTDAYVASINGRTGEEDDSGKRKFSIAGLESLIENPSSIRTAFAAACFFKNSGKLVLVRDQLGLHPLYYFENEKFLAFSTDLDILRKFYGPSLTMDDVWIADALSTVKSEKWRTPYKDIYRLEPGHILCFGDELTIQAYWKFDFSLEASIPAYKDAVEIYKGKLVQAVEKRVVGFENTGVELSGGLDSSALTCIASGVCKQEGSSFFSFTHALPEKAKGKVYPFRDELYYSNLLVKHLILKNHTLCYSEDFGILDMLKQNIYIQSGPSQQGFSMFSDELYMEARENNVDVLLSGFGGDEGVTSRASGMFEELRQNKQWELLRTEFKQYSKVKQRKGIKAKMHYLLFRYSPISSSFAKNIVSRNESVKSLLRHLAFDEEYLKNSFVKERYPIMKGFHYGDDLRETQIRRLAHNHVSQRLEYSYHHAKAMGFEYAYPLLDIDLLEFYLSLPAHYKFRNGMGRAIFRDSVIGILPDEIRLRKDKSFATIPSVHQRFLNDYDSIRDLINRSRKNSFHYLDYDKMLHWQLRLKNRKVKSKVPVNPAAFFNSLQILLLQEMERSGEFKSGIKC